MDRPRLTTLAILLALAALPAQAGPIVALASDTVDLGTVPQGEVVTARFELRNDGDEPLRILEVRTGCNCTVADYDPEIAPGATGLIDAVVDTSDYTGDAGRGITVYTNDPRRPKLFLVIRATIIRSIGVLPEGGLSLTNRANVDDTRAVLLRQVPLEPRDLTVSDLVTNVPWLTARARRLAEPLPPSDGRPAGKPGDWLLEVGLADDAELAYGRGTALVRLRTGLRMQPELELPVDVDLAPPVTLSHGSVDLPAGGEATLLVAVRADLDPATLSIGTEPASLRAEREAPGERRFKLRLRWDGQPADGGLVFAVGGERYRVPVSAAP